jgi:hypothetical protein
MSNTHLGSSFLALSHIDPTGLCIFDGYAGRQKNVPCESKEACEASLRRFVP